MMGVWSFIRKLAVSYGMVVMIGLCLGLLLLTPIMLYRVWSDGDDVIFLHLLILLLPIEWVCLVMVLPEFWRLLLS